VGIPEKIKAIQDEIHKTQINKATEFHVGLLKAKIARLKREMEENTHRRVLSGGGGSTGFDVRKSGDATVILIGLPSVGKSTLLNSLTNAKSRVASYQFTTLTAVPGMMDYCGSKIQILDMPGIIEGAASGKGLGKRVLSVARSADLVLLILDVFQPHHSPLLRKELSEIGIKVDQDPPNVVVEKTTTGGVSISIQNSIAISERLIKEILHVYGIHNGRIIIREPNLTDDQLIDVLSGNRIYIPSLTVLNKVDLVNTGFLKDVKSKIGNNFIPISAESNINIDTLKHAMYQRLDLIRIYLRRRTGETDYNEPLIIRSGSSVGTVCNKIHRKMARDFKFAQVWGRSAKFGGQKVGLDHILLDEDVLTITKKVSAY
jgi:uncharacterized protein